MKALSFGSGMIDRFRWVILGRTGRYLRSGKSGRIGRRRKNTCCFVMPRNVDAPCALNGGVIEPQKRLAISQQGGIGTSTE